MENEKFTQKNEKLDLSYDTLWKTIIRPPRDIYDESDLGEKEIYTHNKKYIRDDYDLLSKRGFIMKCSFLQQDIKTRDPFVMPVVVYLHGNSSSRLEGLKMAKELLERNINIFVFDFPGCGRSEGEYISLGYHEKNDLKVVIDFLEKLPGVGKIGLWGRSMGAATTMIYAHSDNRVKACCVDSPFADFKLLAKDLCKKHAGFPEFVVDTALIFIKKTVKAKNDVDIDQLKPIMYANKTLTPMFFIHAMNDELIPLEHTVQLYENYIGEKSLNVAEGGHNSPRQKHIIEKVMKFFKKYLF